MNDVLREKEASKQHDDIPLVKLSLKNVTYAPYTKRIKSDKRSLFNKSRMERKKVLENVTTQIKPYQLTAWMGPSGSGKTSLISLVANLVPNIRNDLMEGSEIRINGDIGTIPKRLAGVVWQSDLLLSNLSVEETIMFAAKLKTPPHYTNEKIKILVDETIAQLGLTRVRHSIIGNLNKRGISGGERKRVAVAVELVTRPSVLFLDEPTSGLDSTTALELMRTLQDLATKGHSIVAVLHQPRTAIFEMLDSLLLLSRGQVVYSGDPRNVRSFLEDSGASPLPPQMGIADWIMDLIIDDEARLHDENKGTQLLPALYQKYRVANHIEESSDIPSTKTKSFLTLAELSQSPSYTTTFYTQMKILTVRSLKQTRGEKMTIASVCFILLFIGFAALLWWRLPDTPSEVFQRKSLLFFILITQGNAIVSSSLMTFIREKTLLSRERAKKMYGVSAYFIGKTLADMTHSILFPILFASICYGITNLRPTLNAFAKFILVFYLTISNAQSVAIIFSLAIPSIDISLKITPTVVLFLMLIGGFYIPFADMSNAVSIVSWVSFTRYGYSAFVINEFAGRVIRCNEESQMDSNCVELSGDEVLTTMGVEGSFWLHVVLLTLSQLLMRLLAYVMLRRSK